MFARGRHHSPRRGYQVYVVSSSQSQSVRYRSRNVNYCLLYSLIIQLLDTLSSFTHEALDGTVSPVCHKLEFYRNGWTVRVDSFLYGCFFRSILSCILRKFGVLQNKGISLWNFVPDCGLKRFRYSPSTVVNLVKLTAVGNNFIYKHTERILLCTTRMRVTHRVARVRLW